MSKKKAFINALILVIVFTLTMIYVFKDQNFSEIAGYLKNADPLFWILGVLCVVIFIMSESIIIYYLLYTAKQKANIGHCFLYSFIGFFFSCVTPSASGGQPAQVVYMKKDKLPISVSTVVLMIVTVTYKAVIVVIGTLALLFASDELREIIDPVKGWIILGMILNVTTIVAMLILIFKPSMVERLVKFIIRIMDRLKLVKRKEQFLKKVENSLNQYQGVSAYFKTHKLVIWNVFLMTFVQRIILFSVTHLVFCSFGFPANYFIRTITIQALISLSVEMLPVPGGMGAAEGMFLKVFKFGDLTVPAMIVSRGISYYTQLIISAIMMVVAHFVIGRKKDEIDSEVDYL